MKARCRLVLMCVVLAALVAAMFALPVIATASPARDSLRPSVDPGLALRQAEAAPVGSAAQGMPLNALATVGDFDNPESMGYLPWSEPATRTLVDQTDGSETLAVYNFLVPLTQGQTVDFEAQFSADATDGVLFAAPWDFDAPGFLLSWNMGSNLHRLIMLAPQTGTYVMTLMSSSVTTFSLDAHVTGSVYYGKPSISAPKKVKHGRAFTLSARTTSVYDAVTSPIKFEIRRKSGRKYKAYKIVAGNFNPDEGPYPITFLTTLKITKKGTYRVRSVFADAANSKNYSKVWKTISIY